MTACAQGHVSRAGAHFSRTRTLAPLAASCVAVVRPPMPEPMTMASYTTSVGAFRHSWRLPVLGRAPAASLTGASTVAAALAAAALAACCAFARLCACMAEVLSDRRATDACMCDKVCNVVVDSPHQRSAPGAGPSTAAAGGSGAAVGQSPLLVLNPAAGTPVSNTRFNQACCLQRLPRLHRCESELTSRRHHSRWLSQASRYDLLRFCQC